MKKSAAIALLCLSVVIACPAEEQFSPAVTKAIEKAQIERDAKLLEQIKHDSFQASLRVHYLPKKDLAIAYFEDSFSTSAQPVCIRGPLWSSVAVGSKHFQAWLFPCGTYEYKIVGGEIKRVPQYALGSADAMAILKKDNAALMAKVKEGVKAN